MFFKKYYIKARVYLYSIRQLLNTVFVVFMLATLFCFFINTYIFGRVLSNLATNYEISGKYAEAINLYNIEYNYYTVFHFTNDNKERYFKLPYQIASCYLKRNEKHKSVDSMILGLKRIHTQYGTYSRETAYFTRKYLIEYYLDNKNYRLAYQEFKNLLTVYKKIGYRGNEIADMIRLSGDLYYAQQKYDEAMMFYGQSYKAISGQPEIDYETFVKIVNRLAEYDVLNKEPKAAISLYTKTIADLKLAGKKQNETRAQMLISLAEVYTETGNVKSAIASYEQALEIIRHLSPTNYLRQNVITYLNTLKELYNDDGQFHKIDEIEVKITKVKRFSLL